MNPGRSPAGVFWLSLSALYLVFVCTVMALLPAMLIWTGIRYVQTGPVAIAYKAVGRCAGNPSPEACPMRGVVVQRKWWTRRAYGLDLADAQGTYEVRLRARGVPDAWQQARVGESAELVFFSGEPVRIIVGRANAETWKSPDWQHHNDGVGIIVLAVLTGTEALLVLAILRKRRRLLRGARTASR